MKVTPKWSAARGLASPAQEAVARLTEKTQTLVSFVPAGVTVLLAASSMLARQPYPLNDVSLNRSTHTTVRTDG